jgi:hypothetical protein
MSNQLITVREFFQTHYIDTGLIPQSFIDKYFGKTKGNQPNDIKKVCVGDITFRWNGRKPKASTIKSYIKKEDGINWFLFDTLKLAQLDGVTADAWDTLHRAIIVCVVLGPDAMVPATITRFNSSQEVHSTFWKMNGSRSKKVTPEQSFISKVKADDCETVDQEILTLLEKLGDVVIYEDEELFEPANNSAEWSIKYAAAKDLVVKFRKRGLPDYDLIIAQFRLYQEIFLRSYRSDIKPKSINGQLIKALVLIATTQQQWLSTVSIAGHDSVDYSKEKRYNHDWFRHWLKTTVAGRRSIEQQWLYQMYSHDRMEKRHYGTALGIWKDFVSWYDFEVKNSRARPHSEWMESVYHNSFSETIKEARKKAA